LVSLRYISYSSRDLCHNTERFQDMESNAKKCRRVQITSGNREMRIDARGRRTCEGQGERSCELMSTEE
jgi:hypothetical protein